MQTIIENINEKNNVGSKGEEIIAENEGSTPKIDQQTDSQNKSNELTDSDKIKISGQNLTEKSGFVTELDEERFNKDEDDNLLFPGYMPVAFKCLTQKSIPRKWCLKLVTNPWFERITMLVIILNCITLGMYQPCTDNPQAKCTTARCIILDYLDHAIFAYFFIEMLIKMFAMGIFGKNAYMSDSWNRLDFFIVAAG